MKEEGIQLSNEEKKKEHSGLSDSVIGATTTENIERFGRAASEYIKGYKGNIDETGKVIKKGLKQIAESKIHPDNVYRNIKQQAGFSAEVHYVNKSNAESIINRKEIRISRSNDVGLGNDPKIDVLAVDIDGNPIIINGQPLWSAQMKFCGKFDTPEQIQASSKKIAKELASDKWAKYRGNKVLVPSEQYETIKKYAEEEAKKLTKKASEFRKAGNFEKANLLEEKAKIFNQIAKNVTDSGITSKEAIFLRKHPKLATAKYVTQTAHRAGIEQAKAAAIISSVISTSKNIICLMRGEKEIKGVLKDIAVDTATGSATAYIIGAGDTAIRGFMASSKKSIFVNLSKTNLPATIATVVLQVSKSLLRYAKGEIDSIQLIEEIGEKGTGAIVASWMGAVGTVIFPGVGTAIGAMIGYMTCSTIYGAAMQVLHEEQISVERRSRISAIATAAIESMDSQRKILEKMISEFYSNREILFQQSFQLIDLAIKNDNLEQFTEGLSKIAIEMGKALQFKNFDEFNNFMLDKNMVLEF